MGYNQGGFRLNMKREDMLKQLRLDMPRLKKGEEYCCLSTTGDLYKEGYTIWIQKFNDKGKPIYEGVSD